MPLLSSGISCLKNANIHLNVFKFRNEDLKGLSIQTFKARI